MKDDDRPTLDALREAARLEGADPLADPRWDALAEGTASDDDVRALEALAVADPELADAPSAFAPLSEGERARFADAILATLASDAARAAEAPPPSSRRAAVIPLPVAHPPRAGRLLYAVAALAVAAGVGLVVLRGGSPGPALPAYAMEVSGDQGVRGEPGTALALGPGARVLLSLRPEGAIPGDLTARAYVVQGGVALPLDGAAEVSDEGAVRVAARLPAGLALGAAELVVLVGRPAAVNAIAPARVPAVVDGPSLRVVRSALAVGTGP